MNLSKYRIGILEDDLMIAESLEDILETIGHQVLFSVNNGRALLEYVKREEVELLLLDIQVKGDLDGVETAHRLEDIRDIPYVFTTAFADDATLQRVKDTAPYGYVVKPYGIKEIQAAIQVAMLNFAKHKQKGIPNTESKDDHIFVKADGKLEKVPFDKLNFLESKGDYVMLRCPDRSLLIYTTLKGILGRLPESHFMQVHRSYAVQLAKIESMEENSLVIDGKHIPVSKSYMPQLLERLNLL